MLSRDFYCKQKECLPDWAKTLEGQAIAKLLKLLVVFKNKVNGEKKYIEIKNILNHLYDSTQKIYKFTAFAKNRLDVPEFEEIVYFEDLVQMNLPSIVNYIDRNIVIDLYFANFSRFIKDPFIVFLWGSVSEQCYIDKHKIIYTAEQIRELRELPRYTTVHYNYVPLMGKK